MKVLFEFLISINYTQLLIFNLLFQPFNYLFQINVKEKFYYYFLIFHYYFHTLYINLFYSK